MSLTEPRKLILQALVTPETEMADEESLLRVKEIDDEQSEIEIISDDESCTGSNEDLDAFAEDRNLSSEVNDDTSNPNIILNKNYIRYNKNIIILGSEKNNSFCGKNASHPEASTSSTYKSPTKPTNNKMNKKAEDSLYQCSICHLYSKTLEILITHMDISHRAKPVNVTPVNFDEECPHCYLINDNFIKYNQHIEREHSNFFFEVFDSKTFVMNCLVPNVIFRCSKCYVNFFTLTEAFFHSKNCENVSLRIWQCSDCERNFQVKDYHKHLAQHAFDERVVTHDVREEIFNRILCQCPNCAVHFNDTSIEEHYQAGGCQEVESYRCPSCDVLIHKQIQDQHEENHNNLNFPKSKFIVVNYLRYSQKRKFAVDRNKAKTDMAILSKRKVHNDSRFSTLTSKHTKNSLKFMFCKICESYLHVNNDLIVEHQKSNCRDIPTNTCEICGLVVTVNDFLNHTNIHKLEKSNFTDIQYECLQTGLLINPLAPKYFPCSDCEVRFHRSNLLNSHICDQNEYIACEICKLKFHKLAYRLHITFHILSNGNEKLNLFYFCEDCNMVIDSYDAATEHAQRHFSPTFKAQINHCYSCDLDFEYCSYKNHVIATRDDEHKSFTKASYKILKFSFTSIANNEWLAMFTDIPEIVMKKIISNSIYREAFQVKMHVTKDGPVELTLYQCSVCLKYVDQDSVSNHAQNAVTCLKIHKVNWCKMCEIDCYSEYTHNFIHRNIEAIREKNYRVITFYKTIDTCSYQMPNTTVKGCLKKKTDENIKSNKPRQPKINKKMITENVYRFFQCMKCLVCIQNTMSSKKHSCAAPTLRKFCNQCELYFPSQTYSRHMVLHEKHPSKLRTEIVPFKPREKASKTLLPEKAATSKKTTALNKSLKEHFVNVFRCNGCNASFLSLEKIKNHVCYLEYRIIDVKGNGRNEKEMKNRKKIRTGVLPNNIINSASTNKCSELKQAKAYKCSKCRVIMPSAKLLMEHFKNDCPSDGTKCHICQNMFHPSMIESHMTSHEKYGNKTLHDLDIVIIYRGIQTS